MHKICKTFFVNFSLFYTFLETLGHWHYFNPNLYFCHICKYVKFRALVITNFISTYLSSFKEFHSLDDVA